jgi:integrase
VRGHRLEMLLTLALTTGLRRGEMLTLRWTDVDLEHQTVKVQRDYLTIEYGSSIESDTGDIRAQ